MRGLRSAGEVIAAEPVIAWHYQELDEEQLDKFCAAERAAVGDPANEPTFRAALVRTTHPIGIGSS